MSFRAAPLLVLPLCLHGQFAVSMNRYDANATGANTHETVLNVSNVNPTGFGKLYSYYVDGAVYAQPLYAPSISIAGHGSRNVLYVATMNDKFYAFDADKPGAPLWMRDFTDELAGVVPVPVTDITGRGDLNIVGNVGIEGTPVIDAAARSIFMVVRTRENSAYFQRLHKLDMASGRDKQPPAVIEASAKSSAEDAVNGVVKFDPKAGNQRPALALVHGAAGIAIVIAWASHEDIQPYHGWVMAYDDATLKQLGAVCVTPDGIEGGIWQSGRGPAVGQDGSIYFEVGNGDWDGVKNFGSSLLRMSVGRSGLTIDDFFTPRDYEALNKRDADLGSTGPLLIPGSNMLVAGSKNGTLFILDGHNLGHMTPDNKGALQTVETKGGRMLAGPAYWEGPAGPAIYQWSESDFLKAYHFKDGRIDPDFFAKGSVASRGSPGGTISISADGSRAGTGIVWGTVTNGGSADHGNTAGVLYAVNAETLDGLWNTQQNAKRDRLGTLVKFTPPVVAAGKVYIPNYDNAVNVYGLLLAAR
jgi:outer membrane protein assembly factor BamB